MTVAAELIVSIRGQDLNAIALLQRVQVQGLAANTVGTKLAGTFSSLSSAAAQFGVALGAGAIAKEALDLAHLGAQAASARDSFTNLAVSAGTTADALLSKMHAAAAGTVSDTQLMISSNTGLLLVGEKIAGALPKLLEIARAAAKATGQDVSFLYDSLVKGIARGSPKIIDNAGITLDAAAAMDTYARSIGKSADALTSSEQQQATLNAVLQTGEGFIQKIGLSTDSAAVRMQRAQAATDNFKAALGERLAPAIATVADGLTNLLSKGDLFAGASGGASQAQATLAAQATNYQDYVKRVAAANQQLRDEIGKTDPVFALMVKGLDALTPAQFAYAQSLKAAGVSAGEALTKVQAYEGIIRAGTGASEELGIASTGLIDKMIALSQTSDGASAGVLSLAEAYNQGHISQEQLEQGVLGLAAAVEVARIATTHHVDANQQLIDRFGVEISVIAQATQEFQAHIAQLDQDAAKSGVDALASQELATRKELLMQQAQLAANALIASGNAGAATAARLAASSNLVDVLTAAYLRLRAAQVLTNQARLGAQTGQDLIGPRGNEGDVRTFKHEQAIADRERLTKASQAAAAAEREYQQALGNLGPALRQANSELAQLPVGTEAYYKKLTQIQKLQEQEASATRKHGAAVHLSDQAKLNNTLLSDQQRADDQQEALEKAHTKRLLDIDKKYQEASLAQQKTNEINKRRSELDFLEQITTSELNKTKEGRAEITRINERYYADFAAAQAAAQAGNAKQSEEMVNQAKQRADVEIRYAEKIEAARKAKNKDEVARLTAMREKERQLLAEQDKQIQEGGDPIVEERKKAMDEEADNFAEQQGKIVDASDAAAQRKIDNAIREGKNVDTLNLKYKEQEDTINRIAARQPSATAGGGAAGGGPSAPAGGEATAAPADLSTLADAMRDVADRITQAIGASSDAIVRAEQNTTSAVRQASGARLMQ